VKLNAPNETAATVAITLTAREEFLIAAPLSHLGKIGQCSLYHYAVWVVKLENAANKYHEDTKTKKHQEIAVFRRVYGM
jgi:hypothetical protein